VNKYYHELWMSSSIAQNPTFSCRLTLVVVPPPP
jgi:hypothetical protein